MANNVLQSKPNTHLQVLLWTQQVPKTPDFGPTFIWAQAQFLTHLARFSMKQRGTGGTTARVGARQQAPPKQTAPIEAKHPPPGAFVDRAGPKNTGFWADLHLGPGTVSDQPGSIFDETTRYR